MDRGRVGELQVLARILGEYPPHLAAVAHGNKRHVIDTDAAHDPLGAILDTRGPVVATGVADQDPLLAPSPRDDADVKP